MTKKGRIKNTAKLDVGNNEEYKMEIIHKTKVYIRKLESDLLPGLYHLVSWKSYYKEKNTCKLVLVVQYT